MSLILSNKLKEDHKGKIILYNDKKEKSDSYEAYIISNDGEEVAEGYGSSFEEAISIAKSELNLKISKLSSLLPNIDCVEV